MTSLYSNVSSWPREVRPSVRHSGGHILSWAHRQSCIDLTTSSNTHRTSRLRPISRITNRPKDRNIPRINRDRPQRWCGKQTPQSVSSGGSYRHLQSKAVSTRLLPRYILTLARTANSLPFEPCTHMLSVSCSGHDMATCAWKLASGLVRNPASVKHPVQG